METMMSITIAECLSDGSGQSFFSQRIKLRIKDESEALRNANTAICNAYNNVVSIDDWILIGNSYTSSFTTRHTDCVTRYSTQMYLYEINMYTGSAICLTKDLTT